MHRFWTIVAAILGGTAVGLGAMAAHFLDPEFGKWYAGQTRVVSGETIPLAAKFLGDFRTGAEYQIYHALALLAVAAIAVHRPSRRVHAAGWCFLLGCLLFSGSLYILTMTGITRWGAVTPIGGTLLIIGWALLASAALVEARPMHVMHGSRVD